MDDKIYTAKTGLQANKIVDRIQKKYPGKIPSVAQVLKEGIWSL